jgi:hypothetical protein
VVEQALVPLAELREVVVGVHGRGGRVEPAGSLNENQRIRRRIVAVNVTGAYLLRCGPQVCRRPGFCGERETLPRGLTMASCRNCGTPLLLGCDWAVMPDLKLRMSSGVADREFDRTALASADSEEKVPITVRMLATMSMCATHLLFALASRYESFVTSPIVS